MQVIFFVHKKINSFSFDDKSANLYVENVEYSLDVTKIDITFNDIKTKSDETISGEIKIKTFAPGKHHVLNVLGVVGTALSLNIDEDTIINGLKNYKGIPNKKPEKRLGANTVIEEINPGINTKAIEASINMIDNDKDYIISIGGDYGITCEEIDEDAVAGLINTLNKNIILTGEVGKSILNKINRKVNFIEDYSAVYDFAIENNKNLLFIYRSDYRKLSKR